MPKAKTKRVKCPDCFPHGWRMLTHMDGTKTCPTCKGKKTIPQAAADLITIRDTAIRLLEKVKI